MSGKGRTRQLHAWSFAAATVPAVMTCAGIAWPWVLAGCAAAAAFCMRRKFSKILRM